MHGLVVTVTVPLVFVLVAHLLMTYVLQGETRNADHLLKGVLEGVVIYHTIISANQTIAFALFLGLGGRVMGDFAMQRDHWKLASTLLGIAFGVLMADIVSHLTEDQDWSTIDIWDVFDERGSESRRHRPHTPRRRVSEPRRIEELPAVYEELSSIDSRSRVDEGETETEREVARLRAQALEAAGQRRRFREERKWAWSQGNFARAFQLRWQVKKYDALAESFTREADQKLIEADRAKRIPSPTPPPPPAAATAATNGSQYRSNYDTPFVQVVVEGVHDREDDPMPPTAQKSSTVEHKVRIKKTSRVIKRVIKLNPGIQVASSSRGVTVHSRTSKTGKDTSEAPTSDTWSRKLD